MQDVTPAPEEWRPVVGFEGEYEVSDLGRVRSVQRTKTVRGRWGMRQFTVRARILRASPDAWGYPRVSLRGKSGKTTYRKVHHLVLEAFHGPCPEGMEGLHGAGGPADNRASVLRWGTPKQNQSEDRLRDGTDQHGDRHPGVKLTWEQVDEIRRRCPELPYTRPGRPHGLRDGHKGPLRILAEEFGVTRGTIYAIVAGRTWRPEFRRHAS